VSPVRYEQYFYITEDGTFSCQQFSCNHISVPLLPFIKYCEEDADNDFEIRRTSVMRANWQGYLQEDP
jgi:hypothetical protein